MWHIVIGYTAVIPRKTLTCENTFQLHFVVKMGMLVYNKGFLLN